MLGGCLVEIGDPVVDVRGLGGTEVRLLHFFSIEYFRDFFKKPSNFLLQIVHGGSETPIDTVLDLFYRCIQLLLEFFDAGVALPSSCKLIADS